MTYSYRHLSDSDVGLLLELLEVFGDAFEEPETYQGAVPKYEYLQALLSRRHLIAVVALDESDRVVGGWQPTSWKSSSRSEVKSISMTWQWRSLTAVAGSRPASSTN